MITQQHEKVLISDTGIFKAGVKVSFYNAYITYLSIRKKFCIHGSRKTSPL